MFHHIAIFCVGTLTGATLIVIVSVFMFSSRIQREEDEMEGKGR